MPAKPRVKVVYVKEKRRCIRAPGQTQATISLSEISLKRGRQMATEDDRTFSNFVERLLSREWDRRR